MVPVEKRADILVVYYLHNSCGELHAGLEKWDIF